MASILLAIIAERTYKWRDFQAVDIVPAALSLRFQHVTPSLVCINGNADGMSAFWCVVKGVDSCKCGAYAVDICSGRSR